MAAALTSVIDPKPTHRFDRLLNRHHVDFRGQAAGESVAEERVQRRLAAILAADVVGYSRLMGEDEAGTRARFNAHLTELIEPAIANRRGRIVKTTGDALLVEFASVVDAVQCAVDIQSGMAERNGKEPDDRRIVFRIGVNLGDVIIEGDDIHGDGVNVAARLEALADPGGVVISDKVQSEIRTKLDIGFDDLGPQEVKNIAEPVPAYRVRLQGDAAVGSKGSPPPLPDKPSIAVLPFENMSGDAEQEYFADGIAEDIITALSRFHWFFVIARNSSFSYKGTSPDIREVARDLGVQYVLEGSVRKAGSRVRVTAQLIDAATGRHIWADRFDRELEDIFAVQDEITESITAAVAPAFASVEAQRAEHKAPESLDAWDYAIRGNWHFWRKSREDNAEAKRLFEAAIALDPKSSIALCGLTIACAHDVMWGWSDDIPVSRARAIEAAEQAIAADEHDAWAHVALSFASSLRGRHEVAFRAVQRAIDLNPNLPFAEALLAQRYGWNGEYDEAMLHADRAARLSPRDPANVWLLFPRVLAAFVAEKYDEQVAWARKATEAAPDFPGGWAHLALGEAYLGRLEEARAAIGQLLSVAPRATVKGYAAALPARRPEDLERALEGLRMAGLPE